MLLNKRIDENDDIVCVYESSNIPMSIYSRSKKELRIIFKNGTQYKYNDVDNVTYLLFETADSQGKILNSKIKQFEFEKLADYGVQAIQEYQEKLDEIAKENFQIDIRRRANELTSKTVLDAKCLYELKTQIEEYLKLIQ